MEVTPGQRTSSIMLGIAHWSLALAVCIPIGFASYQWIRPTWTVRSLPAPSRESSTARLATEHVAQPTIATKVLHSKTYIPAMSADSACPDQGSSKKTQSSESEQSTQPATSFGSNAPSWREDEISLSVDNSFQRSADAVRALNAALAAWTSAADQLPRIGVSLTAPTSDKSASDRERADHRISFAPAGDPRSHGALAVTVLTIDEDKNSILDADIVVNGTYRFNEFTADGTSDGAPEYDLQSVLTHEIGHWFGLPEDPCNVEATMYQYTLPNETKKRDLTQDDVIAAQVAYWQADNPSGEVGCSFVSRGSNPAAFGIACMAAFVLLARVRQSKRAHGKGTRDS